MAGNWSKVITSIFSQNIFPFFILKPIEYKKESLGLFSEEVFFKMGNDIKVYTFQSGTAIALTSDADGKISHYSAHPIRGKIIKVVADFNDSTSTGSLMLNVSGGTAERLCVIKSFSASTTVYPKILINDNLGNTLNFQSGNVWAEQAVNNVVLLTGSGLGDAKIVDSFSIYYE